MSEHRVELEWHGGDQAFTYETYPRRHRIHFKEGVGLDASAAVEYLGDPDCADPEQALVAAVASCHMLTFLAICARKRRTVLSYRDAPVGTLEKNEEGKLAITRIQLHPTIEWAEGQEPDPEEIQRIHDKSHEHCFIANSVRCRVEIV